MRSMKKITFVLTIFYIATTFNFLAAQNEGRVAQARKADNSLQTCLKQQESNPDLDEEFSIYDWAKNLQDLVGNVLYEESAEVLIEIADEEETARELLKLAKKCDVLANLEKELQKLVEIYDQGLKDKSNTKIDPNKGFQESRKVTFSVADARKMKVQINSLVNRLEGDNSIFRKLR